jgi:hypothetical protein
MGSDLREAGATDTFATTGSSTSRFSRRGVDLRVLRDLGAAASKPSVFNKVARLAGAGGNGIDEI